MATFEEKVLEEAYSVTPNYDVDYNDTRFGKVESDKSQALTELEQTYGGMINDSDRFFDEQIQASQNWADKQAQIQQEKTDFAIEQIEQQKEQANKDYIKEQSGAYVDWQKQSNKYGTEAEKMASAGLTNTGFSESSQVSMYNTYQMRVAMARESYNKAVLNYNNAIKDAQIQNNAALAEIAYNALQKQLELSLQGFQYKNELLLAQANKKTELDNIYYNRYQDVLQQINTENAIKEDIRQFTETQKWNTEQKELDRAHDSKEAELDRQFKSAEAKIEREFKAAQAEIDRKHEKEMLKAKTAAEKEILAQQHKNDLAKLEKQKQNELAILAQQLANDKALLNHKNAISKQSVKISSGSSGSSGSKRSSSSKVSGSSGSSSKISSNTGSSNSKVNMESVKALGYGPISSSNLATKVNNGQVSMTEKNGQIYFSKNPPNYKYRLNR